MGPPVLPPAFFVVLRAERPFFPAPFFGYGYGGDRYFHHFSNYREWESRSPYIANNSYAHGIYRGSGSAGRGFHSGPRMTGARGFGVFGRGFHGGGGFHSGVDYGGGGFGGSHGGGGGGHR